MKKKKPTTVVVLTHWEVFQLGNELTFDSIHEWVFSTWKKAEKFIENCRCDPYAWYSMQLFPIDDDPLSLDKTGEKSWNGETLRFYNHRGKPLKDKPIKQCMKAYLKERTKAKSRVTPLESYVAFYKLDL